MPLNIQPLSPARRLIRLLVLLALLALSVGFAQYLITQRRLHPPVAPEPATAPSANIPSPF